MFFDNTLQVKVLASGVKLDSSKGQEQKLFEIGERIKTSSLAPYRTEGVIIDVYNQNGFWYYVVNTTEGKYTLRTKDIEK